MCKILIFIGKKKTMIFMDKNYDFHGWKLWFSGVKTMIFRGENYDFHGLKLWISGVKTMILMGEHYEILGWKLWISEVKTMIDFLGWKLKLWFSGERRLSPPWIECQGPHPLEQIPVYAPVIITLLLSCLK